MNKLTKKVGNICIVDKEYVEPNDLGYQGIAIHKLFQMEKFIEDILEEQKEISRQLELLRSMGDTKSYKFREQLGHKLVNGAIINKLEQYKLM